MIVTRIFVAFAVCIWLLCATLSVFAEGTRAASSSLIDIEELGSPLISSDFNVYLDQDRNTLIYTREQCAGADLSAMFFLHLIPVDVDDLPSYRKQYGFDNLDFAFRDHRLVEGGVCVARRDLPDYAIAGIRTGQYVERDDGSYQNFWEARGQVR